MFIRHKSLFALLVLLLSALSAQAQTSAFTYQGRLSDGVVAANGSYDMEFRLFDASTNVTQIGSTITRSQAGGTAVTVTNGVFTVNLDYSPATPSVCVGCVTNSHINSVAGSKVTGAVASATNATNAANAQTATTAGNVTGTVAIANGGTGATTIGAARTNLGLGTLATVSSSGTASGTTFLRGDNSWQTLPASNAPGLTFNPTTQTAHFTINPADNYSVYQVNRCGGSTNVTLPTAAAAGAGRVFYIVNVAPSSCVNPNFLLHLVLSGNDWIEYVGNKTIADKLRYMIVSNGVDGWLLILP